MFTRIVEVHAKSSKASALAKAVEDKVLPILRKQVGFVESTVLMSDTDPNHLVALSFWHRKEDAELYHNEAYLQINQILSPLLVGEPVVRTFNVHTSTTHKIKAGKVA